MPLSFEISADDLANARVGFFRSKDEEGRPHLAVQVSLEATGPGGAKLPLQSLSSLDACIEDGCLSPSDRTFLAGLLKKLAERAAKVAR